MAPAPDGAEPGLGRALWLDRIRALEHEQAGRVFKVVFLVPDGLAEELVTRHRHRKRRG